MSARLRYVREVLRQAASFAGWIAGLVTLLLGGSIIGGAAWLAETRERDARFRAGRTGAKPADQVIERLLAKGQS